MQPAPGPRPPKSRPATSGASLNVEPSAALNAGGVDAVAVVAGEDPIVLRMALMVRAVSDDVPLLLTIFDPTMAGEMAHELPNTHVTSLADIVAPSIAGP